MHTLKTSWLLLFLALTVCGCGGATEKYPSDQTREFFRAANEANYRGVLCQSPQRIDLSAYTPYLGVKYPPTASVDVLSAPPSRSYQSFAVLQCAAAPSASSAPGAVAPGVLAQLTAKAKEIGADAIIIRQPARPAAPAKIEAVAIKYCLENPKGE